MPDDDPNRQLIAQLNQRRTNLETDLRATTEAKIKLEKDNLALRGARALTVSHRSPSHAVFVAESRRGRANR